MGPLRRRFAAILFTATRSTVSLVVILIAFSASASVPAARAAEVEEGAPADSGPSAPDTTASATIRDEAPPRYRLDPVVVTPERSPVPLAQVPSDVSVVDRERLDRDQAPFLADELRRVPAIDVQRSGSLGKLSDVRLRGADPRHTLVLFDGVPLNGPWAGTFDFADLPGVGWGQVEVLGGPASSLYGTGAVGGVIQILSPNESAKAALRAFAEYGEHATLRQSVEWNGGGGGLSGGLHASRLTTRGVGPRDEYEGVSGRLHGRAALAGGVLSASGLFTSGEKQIPDDYRFDSSDFTTHQMRDPNAEETDRILAGRLLYGRPVARGVVLEAEASAFAGRIVFENGPDPSTTDYVNAHLDNARGIAALRVRLGAAGPVQAILGAEVREERVEREDDSQYGGFPSVSTIDRAVTTRSLYGQAHLEARRLLLDAGLRVDDHARYGARGVPRVAVGLPIQAAGVKLRAGYGRAFSAPTLSDLYYPFYGSETLRPERSRTWEAGADGRWLDGRVEARATWHTTEFRDLIQSNSFFVAENIGRARIEGEELWVRLAPISKAVVTLQGAHLAAKRLGGAPGSDDRLPKRPRWRAGIAADFTPSPSATASAALRWVDSMVDPFDFYDTSGRFLSGDRPGYASLDLGGSLSLARWVPAELRVRLENALDRSYSEVKGYPALGRSFTAGVTVTR